MKKIAMIIAMAAGTHLSAQTYAEWFQQKKTQIQYLLDQVAASKVYIAYLQKGYQIADRGLQAIRGIKQGDFNLHDTFFKSLGMVNRAVKKLAAVADIILLQRQIIRQAEGLLAQVKKSGQYTVEECSYIGQVYGRLLAEGTNDISQLTMLISSGNTTMTDAERIKRVQGIYVSMQDKFSFSKSFAAEVMQLLVNRQLEGSEMSRDKIVNGIR